MNSQPSPPSTWTPDSWRSRPAAQQPTWPEPTDLERIEKELASVPPLVFAGEARELKQRLAAVSRGEAFLFQAGDCAESFDGFNANSIRDKLRIILQMAVILTYSSGVPAIKVGRIAGQFAKPRSKPTETQDGTELPSFLGHMVNDLPFSEDDRRPSPARLLQAYHQSASTLNLLRAFTKGGFADLHRVQAWNQEFVASSSEGQRYNKMATEIDRALRFMEATGVSSQHPEIHEAEFYTSHEALILQYEQALTRLDSLTGDWYDCSAHMVWIGERTRQLGRRPRRVHAGHQESGRLQGRPDRHRRRGRRAVRGPRPRSRPRPPDPDRPHGSRHGGRQAPAPAGGGERVWPPGGLGL